jgi:hypothetical protein
MKFSKKIKISSLIQKIVSVLILGFVLTTNVFAMEEEESDMPGVTKRGNGNEQEFFEMKRRVGALGNDPKKRQERKEELERKKELLEKRRNEIIEKLKDEARKNTNACRCVPFSLVGEKRDAEKAGINRDCKQIKSEKERRKRRRAEWLKAREEKKRSK